MTARPVSREQPAEPVDLAVPHGAVGAGGAGQDRGVHRVGRSLAARRGSSAESSSAVANVPGTSRPSTALCSSSRLAPTPDRAGVDALGDEVGHAPDVVVGGGLRWPRRAPPSRRRAPRRAAPARRRRARAGCGRARRGTRATDCQSHRIASRSEAPGMPSTPSMRPMSQSWRSGGGGREADAAVAHDDGGDAVPDRRREQRVPGDLAVVVRVHVDEAGRDREAGGVELLATRARRRCRPR